MVPIVAASGDGVALEGTAAIVDQFHFSRIGWILIDVLVNTPLGRSMGEAVC